MSGLQISAGALHISISTAVAVVGILGITAVALGPSFRPVLAARPSPTATLPPTPGPTLTAVPSSTATATPIPTSTATPTSTTIPSPTATPIPTATLSPTALPTATPTPIPTATPVPALSCDDASRVVRGHHRTLFDLLNVVTSGVAFSCSAPTGDARRPVSASWNFEGKPHVATWLISREGDVTAGDDTARTFERVGSLGELLRDLGG
jgi:hypothetical protein